ncbi:MAG: hypothetical protein HYT31_04075 [Parcubacteria group bacterium]|nr:hypothetical protein [Parcubacteria group bacterium]
MNEKLTEFISFSDSALKKSGTLKSLFFKVPFDEISKESKIIANEWANVVIGLETEIKMHFYNDLSVSERQVYDALVDWAKAVADAAKILSENQKKFYTASRSFKNNHISLKEVSKNSRLYNAAQDRYFKLGTRLQKLHEKIV